MIIALPTASRWELADTCVSSALLPHVQRTKAPAERGSAGHRYLELVGRVGQAEALAAVPEEWREACSRLAIPPQTDPASYAHEVSLALNLQTGVAWELGRGQRRKYPPPTPWVTYGTADSLGLAPGAVLIGDYKLGFHRVTRAADNLQLLCLAVAASRAYGRGRAVVNLIYLDEDGERRTDSAELDEFDLDAGLRRMRALAADIYDRQASEGRVAPTYNLGSWCGYCPALASCPGQTGLLRSMAAGMAPAITRENALDLWRRTQAAKAGLEFVEAALEHYASQEPIDLGDGRVYGPVEKKRDTLDGRKTHASLRRVYGDQVAEAAVEMRATKAAIKEALRPLVTKDRKITHLEREALEVIRADGGLKTFRYTSIAAHKPKQLGDGAVEELPFDTKEEASG